MEAGRAHEASILRGPGYARAPQDEVVRDEGDIPHAEVRAAASLEARRTSGRANP